MKQLFGQNVLVRVLKENADEVTAGGIILPGQSKKMKLMSAVVEAIGDGRVVNDGIVTKTDLLVKIGDIVMFSSHIGVVEVDNEHIIIQQSSILGLK